MLIQFRNQKSVTINVLNFIRFSPIGIGLVPIIWRAFDGNLSLVFFATWICVMTTIFFAMPVLIRSQIFSPTQFQLSLVFAHTFLIFFLAALPTVSDKNYRIHPNETLIFVLSSCAVWLGIIWGSALLSRLLPSSHTVLTTEKSGGHLSSMLLLVIIGFISILGTLAITSGSKIPLLQVIRGENYSVVLQSRQAILRAHLGEFSAYFFIFIRNYLVPFALGASIIRFNLLRNRMNFFLMVYLFAVGLFVSLLTMEKSPFARLVLVSLLSIMIYRVHVSISRLAIMLSTTFLGLLALVKVTNGSSSFNNLSAALFHRIFVDPAQTAQKYFEWAPKHSGGFMMGRNLTYLNRFLPSGPVDATRLVYDYIYPLAPVKGNADAAFHAALWVDFSWYGIFIAVIGTSVLLVFLDRSLAAISDVEFRSSARALFTVQTLFMVSSSWGSSILSVGLGAWDIIFICLTLSLINVPKLYKKPQGKFKL